MGLRDWFDELLTPSWKKEQLADYRQRLDAARLYRHLVEQVARQKGYEGLETLWDYNIERFAELPLENGGVYRAEFVLDPRGELADRVTVTDRYGEQTRWKYARLDDYPADTARWGWVLIEDGEGDRNQRPVATSRRLDFFHSPDRRTCRHPSPKKPAGKVARWV